MIIQTSSKFNGISLFRDAEQTLRNSVWCDSCRTLWLSDGELPKKHKKIRTHVVVFKEADYVDKIIYLECSNIKEI